MPRQASIRRSRPWPFSPGSSPPNSFGVAILIVHLGYPNAARWTCRWRSWCELVHFQRLIFALSFEINLRATLSVAGFAPDQLSHALRRPVFGA